MSLLHVMTFNVRRPLGCLLGRCVDRWSVRKPRLETLLRAERPAILGAQEVLPDQGRVMLAALGADYRLIGRGRSRSGTGEACPIIFDERRFELRESDQWALSDTPDRPGSRSWGNPFPRIAVSALLRDRESSTTFQVVNTHLDPLSARSRARSAAMIRERTSSAGVPTIVTGDANDGPDSRAANELYEAGALRDAWRVAHLRETPELATYAGYRAPRPGRRIDWIAVSPDITVERIGIVFRPVGDGWASDHLPVAARVTLPERTHA
ncbi:endonuclease/exonuclease/phosphatase family protein [Leucobacter tardus]|uniref:Endonuclease/exonuclease/phosphatase family protein n=1 Tax=Leucobacter tardus TaxID=501483 RepID=A0A939QCN6_9MICO|nr:endonuclease/exonuclease/phosphatase family protein [Leucobacter tardus]MBO2989735.1 endonuclease/exonuclease/phosphatase family protein [Leucobacter tardus]